MAGFIRTMFLISVTLCGGIVSAAARNELSLSAGIDSSYDSNVYNGRGPDFVNRVNPQGTYRLVDPRVTLEAGYLFGYWTYAFGKADNSLNHRGVFSLEARPIRRLIIRAANEITRAQDPGFLVRVGVVAPQIGITDDVADFLADYAFTRRLHGSVSYLFHMAIFDSFSPQQIAAGFSPLFDGSDHNVQATVSYRIARRDDLLVSARFQNFEAGPQNGSISEFNVANSYSPTAGWHHRFLRELELTADVGPIFYQALSGAANIPGAPQSSATTWRLATRLRYYSPSWRAGLAFSRDLIGATGAGSALWANYLYASAGYQFLRVIETDIGIGFFQNGRAVDQPTSYDGINLDAIVDWRPIDYLRLGAYYSLRWQETGPGAIPIGLSAAQFPAVTRNIVGIRLLAIVGNDARPRHREVH